MFLKTTAPELGFESTETLLSFFNTTSSIFTKSNVDIMANYCSISTADMIPCDDSITDGGLSISSDVCNSAGDIEANVSQESSRHGIEQGTVVV
jgi:hypothetical protein